MHIDHIFIFSTEKGKEADALVEFGCVESEGRIHTGQGTANRKFHFGSFFLEILWVHDEQEIQSARTGVTKLYERSKGDETGYSPFGLCLVNTEDTDILFTGAEHYQPVYFPDGKTIQFIHREKDPWLPWLFRLPFRGLHQKPSLVNHPNGIKNVTKATFYVPEQIAGHPVAKELEAADVVFRSSEQHQLILEFDHAKTGQFQEFKNLSLLIQY
ncbi:MAG: VOC family protein [Bacteroidota bacterium]